MAVKHRQHILCENLRFLRMRTALMKQAATGAQLGGTDAGSERGKPAMVMTRDAQDELVKAGTDIRTVSPERSKSGSTGCRAATFSGQRSTT